MKSLNAGENQMMDGLLAQVARDFRARVIRAEGFLIDELLKDVAEHFRVNLVRPSLLRVVQVPGVFIEEGVEILEPHVRHAYAHVGQLDWMRKKQPDLEIRDAPEKFLDLRGPARFGRGEALEEKSS
jgi:hypothetical protein